MVIRDYDWGFPRISAVAAMEWALESSMQVIGPTLAWCQRWADKTNTCAIQNGNCRCGTQSEYDNLGYKYNVADMPSFYEASESLVVESGFDVRGSGISPALVEFVEGIIEDCNFRPMQSCKAQRVGLCSDKARFRMFALKEEIRIWWLQH